MKQVEFMIVGQSKNGHKLQCNVEGCRIIHIVKNIDGLNIVKKFAKVAIDFNAKIDLEKAFEMRNQMLDKDYRTTRINNITEKYNNKNISTIKFKNSINKMYGSFCARYAN